MWNCKNHHHHERSTVVNDCPPKSIGGQSQNSDGADRPPGSFMVKSNNAAFIRQLGLDNRELVRSQYAFKEMLTLI